MPRGRYTLIGVFQDELLISIVGYVFIIIALLGLQEIAISMSDPFGKDSTDFDTEQILINAYGNAVEYLRERDVKMSSFKEMEANDKAVANNPLLARRRGPGSPLREGAVSVREVNEMTT